MPPRSGQPSPISNKTKKQNQSTLCVHYRAPHMLFFEGSATSRDVAGIRADPKPTQERRGCPGSPPGAGCSGDSAQVGAECPGRAPQKPGPPQGRGVPVPPRLAPPEPGVTPGRPQLLQAPQPPRRRPGLPRSPHAPTGRGRYLGPGPGGLPSPARSAGPGAPRQDGAGRRRRRTDAPALSAEPGRAETPLLAARHGQPGAERSGEEGRGGGGGRARPPVRPSLGGTGAAGALGCPPPGERQGLAGRGEPPVRCAGSAGRRMPRPRRAGSGAAGTSRAAQPIPLGREVKAGPSSGHAEKRLSSLLSPALRRGPGVTIGHTSGAAAESLQLLFSQTDPQAPLRSTPARHLLASQGLSSLGLRHRGSPQNRALPLCSTPTLGKVRVSQGPFSPGAYLYGDSKQLSSNQGLLDPNSLPDHE